MAIYEMTSQEIRPIRQTTFRDAQIQERSGLQRLLRDRIEVIAPGCLVLAEEFGEWEDSRRRIDLLAIDTEANLVVIELKRTQDGGHMELQAIRYASMVSTMTFEQAVRAHERFLASVGREEEDAANNILDHLGWDEPDEEMFAQDVRIILASAQFSRELTSAVMWLNDSGLDIRCVRLSPYADGDRILLDVQQVIPLPEAEAYQVRVREKSRKERESRRSTRDRTKYTVTLDGQTFSLLAKREAMFRVIKHLCEQGVTPDEICNNVSFRKNTSFRFAPGSFQSEDDFIEAITAETAKNGHRFKEHRWYIRDGERIEADDRTYTFSNQWGVRAIEWIGEVLAAFPEHGITIRPTDSV